MTIFVSLPTASSTAAPPLKCGAPQLVVLHPFALETALKELAQIAEGATFDDVVEQVVDRWSSDSVRPPWQKPVLHGAVLEHEHRQDPSFDVR